ncbi:hypothetical protein ACSSVW_001392 [Pseudoalteromonas sp. MBR-15]|jgi:hypothetical protein
MTVISLDIFISNFSIEPQIIESIFKYLLLKATFLNVCVLLQVQVKWKFLSCEIKVCLN